jgi:Tfp pilus assembly protein PilO
MNEESQETEQSERVEPSALNEMKDVTIQNYKTQLDQMRRYLNDLEKDMPVESSLNV